MTGRTTRITAPTSAATVSSGRLGTKVFGLSSGPRSRGERKCSNHKLCSSQKPQWIAEFFREPNQVEDDGPEGDPNQEHPEVIVNT